MKRQPTKLEKLFVNYICDKGLSYLEYIKNFYNSNKKTNKKLNMSKEFGYSFLQRRYANGQ